MDNNVTRIGLVVPPGNVAMERELAMYLADGIAMNVNRLSRPTPAVTKESLLEMIYAPTGAAAETPAAPAQAAAGGRR